MLLFSGRTILFSFRKLYGLSDEAEAASITISSSDDPALFELIADVLDKKNPARDRILAYYKQLKGLKDQ